MELLAGSVGFSGRAWMVMGSVEAALPVSIWEESGHESGFFKNQMGLAPLINDTDMVHVDPGQDGMNRG